MFEGTFKYVLGIFIVYLISYFYKKVELAKIFKKANEKPGKAYIPFVCTQVLIKISHSDSKLFGLTLIPFVNISAYIKIYKDMIKTFGGDEKEAPLYFFMPMVYFTKLGSGDYKVQIHDYDLNNEYLQAQSMLYEPVIGEEEKPIYEMTDPGYYVPQKKKEQIIYRVARRNQNVVNDPIKIAANESKQESVPEMIPELEVSKEPIIEPQVTKEVPVQEKTIFDVRPMDVVTSGPKSVFTDKTLEPDKRHERVVEVQKTVEEKKNPIQENVTGRPKMCPKCGAKLAPSAKVCFLCGTHL